MLSDELNLLSVGLVTGITLVVAWAGWRSLSDYKGRLFLLCNLVGLLFYCGIGYGHSGAVPNEYIVHYSTFIGLYCLSFALVLRCVQVFGNRYSSWLEEEVSLGESIEQAAPVIIPLYLGVLSFSLVYPEFLIYRLWAPPFPSIFDWWNEGLGRPLGETEMVLQSIRSLLFPLFLIALYRVRFSIPLTVALIVLPFYIDYCSTGYTGRSTLIAILCLIFVPMWLEYSSYRKQLSLCLAISSPVLLAVMYVWSASREGELVGIDLPLWEMVSELLRGETSFPIYSERILQFGQGMDVWRYFLWMATLPLPRILFPDKPTVQLNYEIAEILGGILPGESGFTVILTGPITESFYIFGETFFWLHALIIGGLAAVAYRVSSRSPRCVYVYAYFLFAFSYVFPRAGAGGLIPIVINQFLSYYAIYIYNHYFPEPRGDKPIPGSPGKGGGRREIRTT
jgi:hypothetical protein